jgi:hypothetical protein
MSFKDDLKKIGRALAWPFQELLKLVKSKKFWQFMLAQVEELEKSSDPIWAAVVAAVTAVEQTLAGQDGEAKFDAAFEQIIAALTTKGIPWTKALINYLIELAVQALKYGWIQAAAAAPAPAAPTTPTAST